MDLAASAYSWPMPESFLSLVVVVNKSDYLWEPESFTQTQGTSLNSEYGQNESGQVVGSSRSCITVRSFI
ncbi:hypothetical protein BCON_0068g00260 [Botryotinia convoluta]|uniref:Uncharacterized protein n=1 Tax=Botryotinia convoluta TaxID=54673 RepID=A0A4Z1I7A3_9HELO|nr:hypothetical protein BCON_0068g00260 [Botryotinia convoluta]